MATQIGTPATDLEQTPLGAEIVDHGYSFEFFQAVALLERMCKDKRPIGGFSDPADEAVRFQVNPRLAFPASEIQHVELTESGSVSMQVNFMGLSGPSGVLPHPYSELILERLRARDSSLSDFLDLFNHRIISLFYRAWQRSRLQASFGAGTRDFFSQYLCDLLGIGTAGLRDRQAVEDEALIHYMALIAGQSRSAAALEQLLADYFQAPIEVQQFTGSWHRLDESTQCAMQPDRDSLSTQLGTGAVVGDAVWDRQSCVRIRIGPLGIEKYNDFLPGAKGFAALRAITRFFDNDCTDFEVQLVLDAREVPGVQLGADGTRPARLGWTSWAATAPMTSNPEDAILALRG
jgi:type VI secretion system protein ImpH